MLVGGCAGGFPCSMDGHTFVAYHGLWNRDPPMGYKVVYLPFDGATGEPIGQPIDLFWHNSKLAAWPESSPIRPMDVQFDRCGRLLVMEDRTGGVILII